jgi:cytochrome o ubiquinol oxidase operon protein cyoD
MTTYNQTHRAKLTMYVIGFGLSLLLTLIAYNIAALHLGTHHEFPPDAVLVPLFIGLALVQFVVQLIFFLHLGRESKPRWNLLIFSFMALVVFILIFGSLWIMSNLNYHQSATDENTYIIHDEGIAK